MYKIIASLYRYNMRGFNKSIPYFATLSNILVLFIFIYFLIIALLDTKSIFDIWHADSKGEMYLIGAFLVVPLYSMAWFLFPERKNEGTRGVTDKERISIGIILLCFLSNILDGSFIYCH